MEIKAEQLFHSYLTKEQRLLQDQQATIKELLTDHRIAKEEADEQNRKSSRDFNPLDYIPMTERDHSRMLSDLLRPNGPHGQGSLFLDLFLKRLDIQAPAGGNWQVRPEKENVDILLFRKPFNNVIIIENKANDAVDQLNQLYRYWYYNIYVNNRALFAAGDFPEQLPPNFKLIYLVSNDWKKPAAHSLEKPADLQDVSAPAKLPASWVTTWTFKEQLTGLIKEALSYITGNARLELYLHLYIEKINTIKVMNNKTGLQLGLKTFDEPDKWNAFLDLTYSKAEIEKTWVANARNKLKEKFHSNDNWKIEFGNWWDVRWNFIAGNHISVNFWLCSNGNFHFVVPNDNTKDAMIKEIFNKPLYDPIRYVWGTDVEINYNFEIKLRLPGKWAFGSAYDGDMDFYRLVWYAGHQTDLFVEQVTNRVSKFQDPAIVHLLKQFQEELAMV